MRLKVIATGSAGNCYLLYNEKEALVIECGVKFFEVKKALDFNIEIINGAIVSHEHQDHSKYVSEYSKNGIDVFANKSTINNQKNKSHRLKEIEANKLFQVGEFKVLPFKCEHDVPTLGFIIKHKECGNTLFLTDSYFSKYRFKNLNNIIIESNYSEDILEKKLEEGSSNSFLRDRILESHLSIENCVEIFKVNDLSKVNNIVLIHLSESNSNEELFKEKAIKSTNKNVTIANNGVDIDFNLTPF